MTLYSLYRFYLDNNRPYYMIGHEGKYSITTIDKRHIELSLFMRKESNIPPVDTEEIATFTSYENLVSNYPELLL